MHKIKTFALSLVALVFAASAYALINGRIPTRLDVYAASGTFRGKAPAKARLTEFFGGRSIAGAPLELEIVFPTYTVRLGTYYTDGNGYASTQINLSPSDVPSRGNYTLAWTYRGNGNYAAPAPTGSLTVR